MISQLLAQRSNLFGCHWAWIVPSLAPFVCENVRYLLVSQCLVPRLHYRGTEFLAFHGDGSLQTLHDNHRRSLRTTSGELRASLRRILSWYTETICLMTRLTVSAENLLAAIVRRIFGSLFGALRPAN